MTSHVFQFVDHSLPGDRDAEWRRQRRIVRAQAASVTHAETRRRRTIAYRAVKDRAGCDPSSSTQLLPPGSAPPRIQPSLSGSRADPFAAFVRPFQRTEHSLLDHCTSPPSYSQLRIETKHGVWSLRRYIANRAAFLDLAVVVPLMRCAEVTSFYMHRMTRAWVPLALTNRAFLDSLLLMASRHLSALYEDGQRRHHFARLAAQYKLVCVRSLREAIADKPPFSDATVATVLMLAYDEVP